MDSIILDFDFDVNILPKNIWEMMGRPNLTWSHIQIRLENQYRIFPIGWLSKVEVDINGVMSMVTFKVIEIVDDTEPYQTFLWNE